MAVPIEPRTVAGVVLACLVGMLPGCSTDDGDAVQDDGEAANRVVARIDGRPIRARQVDEVVQADKLRRMARGETISGADELALRREALDLLISGEVIHRAAQAAGLQASAEAIDEDLIILKSQFANDDAFQQHLHEAGLNEAALRREAERRILMAAYAGTVTEDLVIDDAEARAIYEQQREGFNEVEQVRVAQIIIRVLPDDPRDKRETARARIEEAEGRLLAGEPFADVARSHSESPFAERGGDLGFFSRGRALPEFEQIVFSTPVGETTAIFETPHGFNIAKVLEKREAGVPEFEEVRTGLMMVLAREQRDRHLRDHVEGLRAAAEILILDPELQPLE